MYHAHACVSTHEHPRHTGGGNCGTQYPCGALSGHELVPLADHVAVFIHDRIPAGHLAHAFPEGATVTHMAGVLHMIAIGVLDLALSGFALVPVGPLRWRQELLNSFGHRAVVALLGNEPALPAGLIPVEIFIRRVELQAAQVRHQAQAYGPGAVAFLEWRVVTRNPPRPYRRHRRGPHGPDHPPPRGPEIHRLGKRRPAGPEGASFLQIDEDLDGLVNLFLGHIALV